MIIILSLAASAILGIFGTVLDLVFFDGEIWLYKHGSETVRMTFYIMLGTACLGIAIVCILLRKKGIGEGVSAKLSGEPTVARVLRLCGGVAFAIGIVIRLIAFLFGRSSFGLPDFAVCIMLFLGLAAGAFFFPELEPRFGIGGATTVCGMLGVAHFVIDLFAGYADMVKPIAADYRILTALCLVSFLLLLTSELRMRVHEPHPVTYIALACIACVVCASTYFGRLVLCITGVIGFGDDLGAIVCGVGCALYAVSVAIRLSLTSSAPEGAETEAESADAE
ncbi:MAG: hypothetical protein IJY04_03975 [Clostridia bacterium]|nr:hypothetical protein [Clostridia bacterium]